MVCASDLMMFCLMQERHWKRTTARAVAHEIAAVSRSSMLKHTAAIDEELQSCQQKVWCLARLLVMTAESLSIFSTQIGGHCSIKGYHLLPEQCNMYSRLPPKAGWAAFTAGLRNHKCCYHNTAHALPAGGRSC